MIERAPTLPYDKRPFAGGRHVSLTALRAGMPKRDLAREAELSRRAREMVEKIKAERANG